MTSEIFLGGNLALRHLQAGREKAGGSGPERAPYCRLHIRVHVRHTGGLHAATNILQISLQVTCKS
jgi:hypothetical protein